MHIGASMPYVAADNYYRHGASCGADMYAVIMLFRASIDNGRPCNVRVNSVACLL